MGRGDTSSGGLEKLTVLAYAEPDYSGDEVGRFEAYLNPSELTSAYELEYDESQGVGTTNGPMKFTRGKPGTLSLTFFIDGTGASGYAVDVQEQIAQFQLVTGYSGKIHEPNYLKVAWGSQAARHCVLGSASITYKLFKPSGVPLRAVITATFIEHADDETRVAMAQDESSDLTHVRLVRDGDTLPGLCTEIYGSPHFYIQVARVNRLPRFRRLEPGTRLVFPPLQK